MKTWPKDPDATLDWKVDWSAWLDTGETITTSTWIVADGITRSTDSHDDTSATIWLTGGATGGVYTITNRITTNQGRTDDRSLAITVYDR